MARSVAEGFDTFLSRLTPTKAQREAGATHRASVKGALESRLQVSRFRETGSFSHGTGIRGYSDVDLLVSLGADRPGSSWTALGWVKDALQARFPSTPVKIRRPAVVAEFGGGYETWEMIPGFITGRGGDDQFVYDVPSASSGGGWIDSAPGEHLLYVNKANKKPHQGDAKALTRLSRHGSTTAMSRSPPSIWRCAALSTFAASPPISTSGTSAKCSRPWSPSSSPR